MYTHILIPVALDHDHAPDAALAVARELLAPGGRITAIHVLEPVPGFVARYMPDRLRETQIDTAMERLHAAIGDPGIELDVIEGSAGLAICDFANEVGADLIVVASHRPGLSDYFLGSTAGRVVRHARCAVHVLR